MMAALHAQPDIDGLARYVSGVEHKEVLGFIATWRQRSATPAFAGYPARRSKGRCHGLGPISPSSAEGWLVERPELAAVQLRPFAPQLVARLDADPHMLADRALVEAVGLAGELQLAVERLVRDAEQRAIGDAEAIALAGDGR